MNLITFFDPENIEHIKAYDHLCHQGRWPIEFWVKIKDMEIPNNWAVLLAYKMADFWVDYMFQGELK